MSLPDAPPVVYDRTPEDEIEAFLADVYRLAGANDLDAGTDRIFDFLDRLLCDGQFEACDEVLQRVEVAQLPAALMRSFLTITAPARAELPSRSALYRRIAERMTELKGPDVTRRLIGHLA